MEKLKILHYIPVYAPAWQFGGPVLSVSQLCEGLATQEHEVEVFTSNAGLTNPGEVPLDEPVIRNGVKVTYFPQEPGMGIVCPGMETAVTQRISEFDVLHVTGVWQRTSWAACQAAQKHRVPYVVSLRGALGPYSWRHKTLKKIIYYLFRERSNVTQATAVHYTTYQELKECRWLRLPGHGFIVPNGFDFEAWQPNSQAGAAWRQKHSIPTDSFLVLSVGRLHHKKGLDLLPPMFAQLETRNWHMVFLGTVEDQTKAQLEKRFAALNLQEHVRFLEAVPPEELTAIYSAADLFVLPSRHENFGNVVIEALACQCPVMISDKVGLQHEVRQAQVGWVLPRIAELWAFQLEEIMDNTSLLKTKSAQARSWAIESFSHQNTALRMATYYQKVREVYVP